MVLDLKGKSLGRLTVLERAHVERSRNAMWLCRCECGNEIIAAAANIGKTTQSCGCLQKESVRKHVVGNTYRRTHNRSGTPEYQTWTKMKQRCYSPDDPKYYTYGARGITVCDRWRDSFENFFADMGLRPSSKHSIDRKNVDGNYEPGNCRWATIHQQMRNTTRNVFVNFNGETKCIAEWCQIFGIPRWKPYEMCRGTGRDRMGPPKFNSPEEAQYHLLNVRFIS